MDIVSILKNKGIGVIPTDTLYGLVGSALSKSAVERIYYLKGRDKDKPLIILISSINDLRKFRIYLDEKTFNMLDGFWPGKVSVILPCDKKEFEYLHRGTNSLAFRLPADEKLIAILEQTGPLVAPSANIQNEPPAKNIEEAKKYFGKKADFYLDRGTLDSEPSTLIKIIDGRVEVIRAGAIKI
jgi:L-threonylcarbamoyladenylate synthase